MTGNISSTHPLIRAPQSLPTVHRFGEYGLRPCNRCGCDARSARSARPCPAVLDEADRAAVDRMLGRLSADPAMRESVDSGDDRP